MFEALVLDHSDEESRTTVQTLEIDDLPDAGPDEVLVEVLYSSLNYKDGLAVTGAGKIIRGEYPMVPGIDLVGRVKKSRTDAFESGDHVIGTGWQLGEVEWGGYTQRAKVSGAKLVPLPDTLTPKQAMGAGTAGFTAMLSVMALEEHGVDPDEGAVVVTGASGGAGSLGVTLLSALDYDVVASTGSEGTHGYLRERGADRIIERSAFEGGPERPMEAGKWAGALDAVGGDTLATLISQTRRRGAVASFGNAGGHELNTSVFPFILRGVRLVGIDSNTCPNDRRRRAWRRLGSILTEEDFEAVTSRTITLDEIPSVSQDVLSGDVRGRVVVDVQG